MTPSRFLYSQGLLSSFAASDAREKKIALPGCLLYRKGCARKILFSFYMCYQIVIRIFVGGREVGAAKVRFRIVALSTIK